MFEIVDEIEKDVPMARDMVATFVSRAVVDEVLPPSFLSDAVVCNLGGEVVEHAKRMLSRDHGGGLLDRSWGPGDGRPVADMKVALDQCLQEYLLSGDLPEAARCIRELNAKFFLHEVVKRAVSHAVDKSKVSLFLSPSHPLTPFLSPQYHLPLSITSSNTLSSPQYHLPLSITPLSLPAYLLFPLTTHHSFSPP